MTCTFLLHNYCACCDNHRPLSTTRSGCVEGPRPSAAQPSSRRAPAQWAGNRHHSGRCPRHQHRGDQLSPAKAGLGRAGRGDRRRQRTGAVVAALPRDALLVLQRSRRRPRRDRRRRMAARRIACAGSRCSPRSGSHRSGTGRSEWRDAAGSSDYLLELSASQLRDLGEELTSVIERYRKLEAGPDPARVIFCTFAFPQPDGRI